MLRGVKNEPLNLSGAVNKPCKGWFELALRAPTAMSVFTLASFVYFLLQGTLLPPPPHVPHHSQVDSLFFFDYFCSTHTYIHPYIYVCMDAQVYKYNRLSPFLLLVCVWSEGWRLTTLHWTHPWGRLILPLPVAISRSSLFRGISPFCWYSSCSGLVHTAIF